MAQQQNLLQRFMAEKTLQPCSLSDGVTTVVFHLNPEEWDNQSEFLYYEAPTRAGYVRWEYGTKPNALTLTGFTGHAGLAAAPGGLYDLEKFRPQPGRPNTMLMLAFPARFKGVRYVKMNKMSDRMSTDRPLYFSYEMELSEYGPSQPVPAIRLTGNPTSLVLPVGG
jgi:hypothetical protein